MVAIAKSGNGLISIPEKKKKAALKKTKTGNIVSIIGSEVKRLVIQMITINYARISNQWISSAIEMCNQKYLGTP